MPIPTPKPNEAEGSFMSRCIRFVTNEGTPQEQAIAICSSQYRKEKLKVITWKTIDRKRQSYNKYAKTEFSRALKAQANEYLDQVKQSGLSAEYTVSRAPIENAMFNVYSRVMTQFARDTFSDLSKKANKTEVNWGEWVARWFQTNTTHLIDGITERSQKGLAKLAELAVKEGWSIREYQKNASQLFEVSERRAELIGRTEIIRASNAGSLMGAQETGFPMMKYWLATRDNRTRGTDPKDVFDHYSMDEDKGILLDQPFNVSGENLQHPGDIAGSPGNTINCRCTLVYQVIDTPQGQVIEETVQPTEFDFSGKTKQEREWHEHYKWGNDKQLSRVAIKTNPLREVVRIGKQAYHNSSKRRKSINMNGYKIGQSPSKRVWHHEFGHAIDMQFDDLLKDNADILRAMGQYRYKVSQRKFSLSNLALADTVKDVDNLVDARKSYIAIRKGKPTSFSVNDWEDFMSSSVSKRELRKDLENLFDNGVVSLDEIAILNGLEPAYIEDIFEAIYKGFASSNPSEVLKAKEQLSKITYRLDLVNDALKSGYTWRIQDAPRVFELDYFAQEALYLKYGRDPLKKMMYYQNDEYSNFQDFFGSLGGTKHGVKGHGEKYYLDRDLGFNKVAKDGTLINESHIYEGFANHVALRASDIAPIHQKIMNRFFPNTQNKFYHILDVMEDYDAERIITLYESGRYDDVAELLIDLIDDIERVGSNAYIDNPYTISILNNKPSLSVMNDTITNGYVRYRTEPDFIDALAELLLFSPESYFVVESFKSVITIEKYRKLVKYMDTAVQSRTALDENIVDEIINDFPNSNFTY